MKKNTKTNKTMNAAFLALFLSSLPAFASTIISDFTSTNFYLDTTSYAGNTGTATYTQGSNGITISGPVSISDLFYGNFGNNSETPQTLDLSGYTSFSLLMTLNGGTNPNLPFLVTLKNADGIDAGYFEGYTTGLGLTPTLATLTYMPTAGTFTSAPLTALTSVAYFDFSWNNGGTVNTTLYNLQGIPEPSTGALMMIGAVGLVALRRLRKV
jgi:hypothetical protein